MVSSLTKTNLSTSSQTGQLGVDIGTHAVKVARVERANQQWLLRQAYCEPILADEQPLEAVERAVAACIGTQKRWLREIAACSHSQHLVVRNGNLPLGNSHNAIAPPSILPTNERMAPSAQILAWRSSWVKTTAGQSTENAAKLAAHYITISPETANMSAACLAKVSADCSQVESLPFALARAGQLQNSTVSLARDTLSAGDIPREDRSHQTAGQVLGIIDWSSESPLFVLTKQGLPFYTRQFRNCGFGQVLQLTGERLGIEPADIAKILQRLSTDTGRNSQAEPSTTKRTLENALLAYVSGPLNEFAQQIHRTLQFLASEHQSQKPKHLLLCGGGAVAPQIDQIVESRTNCPTSIWKLPREEGCTAEVPSSLYATAAALSAASIV